MSSVGDSGYIVIGDNGLVRHAGLPTDYLARLHASTQQGWKLADTWFMVNGGWIQFYDQGWWAGGIPQDCFTTIGELRQQGVTITDARLSPAGDWIVLGSGGTFKHAPSLDQSIIDSVAGAIDNSHVNPTRIVFSPAPNSWCLITDQGKCIFKGEFPSDAAAKMNQVAAAGQVIHDIVFPPSGGWVLFFQDTYWASGIPNEAFQALADVRAAGSSVRRLAFAGIQMTFTFTNYNCIQTRSEPSLGIGGDDTDTAEIDVKVGGVTFTARTPNSVNVGSNSQLQQVNLDIGPVLVPDPATLITVALQIVNTGDQSLAETLLVQGGEAIINAAEGKLLGEAFSTVAANVALGILEIVTVAGLEAATHAIYSAFSHDDDGLVGVGGMVGNCLGFFQTRGARSDNFEDPNPSSGRPPHYQLNWSVGTKPVGEAHLVASSTPTAVSLGTPTWVTINAKDSVTSELIPGQVTNGSAGPWPTNQRFQATFNWITKTITYREQVPGPDGKPDHLITVTKTYKDYPSVTVSADGYDPVTVQLGPAQKPPPPD